MTSNITFRFAGDVTPLKRATKSATSELEKLSGKFKASFSPANLLGPVAAAASVGAIVDVLKNASKAYVEDAKSQAVLARTMEQTTGATDAQVKSIEDFISKMQTQTSIIDTDLRQSYSTLIAATGDAAKSQELLTLAADVSAGSGKDLTTVTAALAKAQNGQLTSLNKLIPGINKAKDPMAALAKTYGGMAESAADTDPFKKMQIVIDELNESLGAEVTPYIEKFVDWMGSAEGVDAVNGFKAAFKGMFDYIDLTLKSLEYNPAWQGLVAIVKLSIQALGGLSDQASTTVQKATSSVALTAEEVKRKFIDPLSAAQKKTPEFQEWLRGAIKQMPELKTLLYGTGKQATEVAQRIKDAASSIKNAGQKFKESISFGEFLDEKSGAFDAGKFMAKFRGVVAAAKALPAKLKQLQKAGASTEVLQQVLAMGPEQGLAVAEGFLSQTGSVASYSKSLGALSTLGQKSAAATMTQNTYEINVTKANMTAEEIIAVIQKYERKTGKKVALGG